MAAASIRSVKLDEEETLRVARQAHELGLYEHGFIRAAVRLALGLPVEKGFRDHVARMVRSERAGRQLVG